MTGELFINGQDAYTAWGVNMGEKFIDAIAAPPPVKDYIETESRLEHGRHIDTSNVRQKHRELTLPFTLMADTEAQFRQRKAAFVAALCEGGFTLHVPALGEEVYSLVYKNSANYAQNTARTFCKFSVKAEEPNPTDR